MRAALLLLCSLAAPLPAQAEEWRSVAERDGVRVFARPGIGSPLWSLRALGTIAVPPEQLLGVLADTAAFPQNLPPTESVRVLRREGASAWVYLVIHPPFISRRDSCIRMTVSRLPEGRLRSEWVEDAAGCPPSPPGIVRMGRNRGSWLLTPAQGGLATDVVYDLETDPAGQVPVWLVNRGTARSLPDLFRTLRRVVAGPRYAARPPGGPIAPSP